jgi:hypothetical protein
MAGVERGEGGTYQSPPSSPQGEEGEGGDVGRMMDSWLVGWLVPTSN